MVGSFPSRDQANINRIDEPRKPATQQIMNPVSITPKKLMLIPSSGMVPTVPLSGREHQLTVDNGIFGAVRYPATGQTPFR